MSLYYAHAVYGPWYRRRAEREVDTVRATGVALTVVALDVGVVAVVTR